MNRYVVFSAFMLAALSATAQDTYENARLQGGDLNGTARYVGMGGALEALGADISAISTNPAAIGVFRHSYAGFSLGVVSQQDAKKFGSVGTTNLSFDQAGFVYSMRTNTNSFFNFAFNYRKHRNFDQILSAANNLRNASLAKHIFAKSTYESDRNGGYYLDKNNSNEWVGYRDKTSDERAYPYTQLDYLYTNAVTMDDATNPKNPINTYMEASDYWFNRAHSGWISEFDFNLSGNIDNRIFLGMTLGINNVNYEGYSVYGENILDAGNVFRGTHELTDERKITGTGVDLKLGAIFRPIDESPFRIGVSVATPTWYDLTSKNFTVLRNNTDNTVYTFGADQYSNGDGYDFKYYTPWKFGLSLGHTIEDYVALGASYEYTDCSSADTRVKDGYDYYGNADSYSDKAMNDNTDKALKGMHTLKVGAEIKPDPAMAVRFGYNYVSPMFNNNGVRDNGLDSEGNTYTSTADYTNWKDTHRVTCGVGYKYEKLSFDLAYQYCVTNGTFHPFQDSQCYDPDDKTLLSNIGATTDVSNKRHQILFTLGYTF